MDKERYKMIADKVLVFLEKEFPGQFDDQLLQDLTSEIYHAQEEAQAY